RVLRLRLVDGGEIPLPVVVERHLALAPVGDLFQQSRETVLRTRAIVEVRQLRDAANRIDDRAEAAVVVVEIADDIAAAVAIEELIALAGDAAERVEVRDAQLLIERPPAARGSVELQRQTGRRNVVRASFDEAPHL